jgi:hypothetical protein
MLSAAAVAVLPPPEAAMITSSLPVRRLLAWLDSRAASDTHCVCDMTALQRVARLNGGTPLVRNEQQVRIAFSESFHGHICITLSPQSLITEIRIDMAALESTSPA